MLTQPDFPEPVVPATSRCGMRARSVQTALPAMSLPSQTDSGEAPPAAGPCRPPLAIFALEDVAEVDHAVRWLGTSTPTACLPGIGARIRMSVEASA